MSDVDNQNVHGVRWSTASNRGSATAAGTQSHLVTRRRHRRRDEHQQLADVEPCESDVMGLRPLLRSQGALDLGSASDDTAVFDEAGRLAGNRKRKTRIDQGGLNSTSVVTAVTAATAAGVASGQSATSSLSGRRPSSVPQNSTSATAAASAVSGGSLRSASPPSTSSITVGRHPPRDAINSPTTELKRNKSSPGARELYDRLQQQNQHSSSCPTLVRASTAGMLAVTSLSPDVGMATGSQQHLQHSQDSNPDEPGVYHKSMLNLVNVDALDSTSFPSPPVDAADGYSSVAGRIHQRQLTSGKNSSTSSTPVTSLDAGVVQICINDVSVDGGNMDNGEDDDLDEDESTSLEAVKRQRRRLSWCPEDDRKREEKEEKQKMLGIGGRSQSLSSLDGQDDEGTDDSDNCDNLPAESPCSANTSRHSVSSGSGKVNDLSQKHNDRASRVTAYTNSLTDSRHTASLMDDDSGLPLDTCQSTGLQPERSPQRDRSRSVIELVSEPGMSEQLEGVLRKFKVKDDKPSRRDSVFSKISSYRQKWLNERNSKSFRNTHQFVPVSFSNSTACDVCSKPLSNKAALQCENCAVNVHESSCKDQNMLCPRYIKNTLTNSQSVKDRKPAVSPNSAIVNLRGTQSLRETSTLGCSLLQVLNTEDSSSVVTRNSPIAAVLNYDDTRTPSDDVVDGPIMHTVSNLSDSYEETLGRMSDVDDDDDHDLLPREKEPEAWSVTVDMKTLKRMNNKDIKRQDHIWELIQTEKSHYRTLKIMQKVFARTMVSNVGVPQTTVDQIFPCLDVLLDIHRTLIRSFVERQSLRPDRSIDDIGDLLTKQFDGQMGLRMKKAYGDFCSRHMEAVNVYKELHKTDRRFQNFIAKCSRNSLCKRLGIPECILLVTQRVTKYPLLIEAIIKTTKETNVRDRELLSRSLALIQDILRFINRQVDSRQKEQRLEEISRRIDPKAFTMYRGEKVKKSDLLNNKRKLHHEGSIKWMSARGKPAEVLAVVLSDLMFFLSESNQKYTFFAQDNKSSVISLSKLLVREKGDTRDSKGVYLICPSKTEPEMYELVCRSMEERREWIAMLREAIANCSREEAAGTSAGNSIDTDEEQLLREAEEAKLQQLLAEIYEKDHQLHSTCDDKLKIILEVLEVLGGNDSSPQLIAHIEDEHNHLSPADSLQIIMNEETQLLESFQLLANHRCSDVNVDSNAAKSPTATLSLSLPKRAETFSGFEGKGKGVVVTRRRHASGCSEGGDNGSRRNSLQNSDCDEEDEHFNTSRLNVSKTPRRASITIVSAPDDAENNNVVARTARRLSATLDPASLCVVKSGHRSESAVEISPSSRLRAGDGVAGAATTCSRCVALRSAQCDSLSRLVQQIHSLVNFAVQKGTENDCLRAQLAEAKSTIARLSAAENERNRPGFHHDKQLEELRTLQSAIQQERVELSRARDQQREEYQHQQEQLQQTKAQVDKWQLEMKCQKDELQRQRDALQRQIDLFEEQRRQSSLVSADRRGSPPFGPDTLRRSESPSTTANSVAVSSAGRLARTQSGLPLHLNDPLRPGSAETGNDRGWNASASHSQSERHLSPAHQQNPVDAEHPLARVSSAGSLSASRREALPVHLLSATNESRLSSGTGSTSGSIRLTDHRSVQQIIPTKLSKLADSSGSGSGSTSSRSDSSSSGRSRPDLIPEKYDLGISEKAKLVGGHPPMQSSMSQPSMRPAPLTSRLSTSSMPPCGNILPMKLAEGHSKTNCTTSHGSTSIGALSAGDSVRPQHQPPGSASKSSSTVTKKAPTSPEVLYF